MRITVAICTWNRAPLLRQTLQQLTALRAPPGAEWELLVVDNNSNDATAETIASFERALPIRRIFEPAPGKAHAANHALREARGDYIVWTDDDVLVDEEWLVAYATAFAQYPTAGFFGGAIRPWFPNTPPAWLRQGFSSIATAYAAYDAGPDARQLEPGQMMPFGANMAFRTTVQRAFPFDPSLGPRPGSTLRGEESDVFARMNTANIEGWWVPQAAVRHYIPPDRQTTRYIRGYFRGIGQWSAMTPEPAGPTLFGKPRWMWRAAVESEAKYRLSRMFERPEAWLPRLRDAAIAWGKLQYAQVSG